MPGWNTKGASIVLIISLLDAELLNEERKEGTATIIRLSRTEPTMSADVPASDRPYKHMMAPGVPVHSVMMSMGGAMYHSKDANQKTARHP